MKRMERKLSKKVAVLKTFCFFFFGWRDEGEGGM